jgi:hypothetical protein
MNARSMMPNEPQSMYAIVTEPYDVYRAWKFESQAARKMTMRQAARYATKCIREGAKHAGS